MPRLSESALRRLVTNGETSTVELKVASPRPTEMAERLCGMANAQGGFIIVGVEDTEHKIVGVPDKRMALTKDVILRDSKEINCPRYGILRQEKHSWRNEDGADQGSQSAPDLIRSMP